MIVGGPEIMAVAARRGVVGALRLVVDVTISAAGDSAVRTDLERPASAHQAPCDVMTYRLMSTEVESWSAAGQPRVSRRSLTDGQCPVGHPAGRHLAGSVRCQLKSHRATAAARTAAMASDRKGVAWRRGGVATSDRSLAQLQQPAPPPSLQHAAPSATTLQPPLFASRPLQLNDEWNCRPSVRPFVSLAINLDL